MSTLAQIERFAALVKAAIDLHEAAKAACTQALIAQETANTARIHADAAYRNARDLEQRAHAMLRAIAIETEIDQ